MSSSFKIACTFLLPLSLSLSSACSDDAGDRHGTPMAPAPARADAAPDTAHVDVRAEAGANEVGPADVLDAPAEVPAAVLPTTGAGASCDSCERRQCGSSGGDFVARCLGAVGAARAGARKDVPRAQLCSDVLACIRRTACAADRASDCYCGPGVNDEDCAAGKARGACKEAVEAGAESADAKVVMGRLFDPSFATGNAFTLIEACDRALCLDACKLKAPVGPGGRACPTSSEPRDRCPDLDGNCTPDCRETLAQNPGFRADGAGWAAEPSGGSVGWDTRDADGQPGAGALAIWNDRRAETPGAILIGARQCIPDLQAGRYELAVNVYIASGQSGGSAGIAGEFHASADCTGPVLPGTVPLALAGKPDEWLAVSAGSVAAPATARSLSVRLVVAKALRLPPLRALFDNVLVAKR